MLCDNCGSDDAVVHLTQIVNKEMSVHHLCERCAAEKGIDTPSSSSTLSVAEFLAQMGQEESSPRTALASCSFCGVTFQDFRRSGRLGCPHCYTSFEAQLRALLRRIHGSTQHVGKVYLTPDTSESDVARQLSGLRRKLERAVEREDFELAARIRDEIRALEPTA